MKKYICPNCGFKSLYQTAKQDKRRLCNNCLCEVYKSKIVLESMMRVDILNNWLKI